MSDLHLPADMFIPRALQAAPIIRESRIVRDLTMPDKDWESLEAPSWQRIQPRAFLMLPFERPLSSLLLRQAE